MSKTKIWAILVVKKSETYSELTARAELQLAKQDSLAAALSENGFKLRQLIASAETVCRQV
jgi:hypothetical protein